MTSPTTLGAYRMIAGLGHGGMADVFLAVVEGPAGAGFSKLAVVKTLRPHLVEDAEFVAMLIDEARLTARLSHPNVVQLFEVGEVDGQYFLAMEYLEGQSMRRIEQRAARAGVVVAPEVYYVIISDVLAGLHHAHELADYDGTPLEVVHRDVTPHNVLVTYDGAVKVVDFGIAKATGRSIETQQGVVKGKYRYMSPEQASGANVDRRTDVFAAGTMLWNASTGQQLWAGSDDLAVPHRLGTGDYCASPREVCPDVPEEIDRICRKALAFDREDRYATADQMRADLEAFLGQSGVDARRRLGSAMKELFKKDRAQLRTVLEASGLTSAVSVDTFTASAVSRGAPAKPAPAMDDEATAVPPRAPRGADLASPSVRPAARVSRGARTLALAAVVSLVAVVAGGGLVVARGGAGARAALARSPAELAPQRTTLGVEARGKSAATVASSLRSADLQPKVERLRPAHPPKPSGPRAPGHVDAPSAVVASAAEPARLARTKPAPLDNADPWTSSTKFSPR